jgi:hypothetical protein
VRTVLRCKRVETDAHFRDVARHIEQYVARDEIDARVATTLARLQGVVRGRRAAFAWSGGKDSQVILWLCHQVGVTQGVLGLAQPELEYPAVEAWLAEHRPDGVEVYRSAQDLRWLGDHPHLLFPKRAAVHYEWWKLGHWAAQQWFAREYAPEVFIFGRRTADGNTVGPGGLHQRRDGVVIANPIHDWTHEEVLAFNHYYGMPEAPYYRFPNGYKIGTGPWGDRSDLHDDDAGWGVLYAIDPVIVERAATVLPGARGFLERRA